jgi:hypothetical protein
MSAFVTLSPRWLEKAKDVGARRFAYARQQGYQNQGGLDPDPMYDRIGAVGEAAVAKHFGEKWHQSVGKIDEPDVGRDIEVRTRSVYARNRNLYARPKDHDDRPYVLVHTVQGAEGVWLIGWRFAAEVKETGQWDEHSKRWYASPPYRPLYELEQRIREQNTPPHAMVHTCIVCGAYAMHGRGVALLKGREGTWYCGTHKPD